MIYLNDLKKIINDTKKVAFTNPELATDEDALGLIVSKLCGYNGHKIFNVLYSAFEDSNYHKFNSKMVQTWIETERFKNE
tara:strand:+ start:3667 stop:3906 length:240 start_codon:yes stop_codon:yes gene_type:complete